MRLNHLYRRARRKLREDGIVVLLSDSVSFAKRGFSLRNYQSTRVDMDKRLEMITANITPEDRNVLDIGCAEGNITAGLADEGLFSIGIDRHPDPIQLARDTFGLNEGIGFVRGSIGPESIDSLPGFDVILLLTVYHHWDEEFGSESAKSMLETLGTKSNKIFFEVPESELPDLLGDGTDQDVDPARYEQHLEACFDETVDVEHLGTTSYRGEHRRDPLFLISCPEYGSA